MASLCAIIAFDTKDDSMNVHEYAQFFENLDEEVTIDAFKEFFEVDAVFVDPFNRVMGVEKIYAIFQSMYQDLISPRFTVIEIVQNDSIAYLRWKFDFTFSFNSIVQSFEGVSRVEFADCGKVKSHVDYWDAASNIYEKLPYAGALVRLLKRKLAH